MMPLPVTVVAGYLGAGKTTLINRLLGEDHGLRLMVIVNDFGAINIDAALLDSATEDTITLTNGCACCTINDDLHTALDQALDRTPRPDHVIVEASGIADPAEIANAAIAEPELSYGGIVTLVDGLNAPNLLADTEIGPQVTQQIATADLTLITKIDTIPNAVSALCPRNLQVLEVTSLAPVLFGITPLPKGRSAASHPAYTTWQFETDQPISRRAFGDKLETRPDGLYRLKGHILTDDGGYEVHIVGGYVSARRAQVDRTQLVALGLANRITRADIARWWSGPEHC